MVRRWSPSAIVPSAAPQPWDILAKNSFNTQRQLDDIDPAAADNILLAWPPIMACINQYFPHHQGRSVLDYGCGTGAFCRYLAQEGFAVTGIDSSSAMIHLAEAAASKHIRYIIGDHANLPAQSRFDIITSIMTFPFIDDVETVLAALTNALSDQGILIFAVFNPAWVTASLKNQVWFADFDSVDNPKKGLKLFGNLSLPVYIRDEAEYHAIATHHGLEKIMENKPAFTQQFLEKYPDYFPNTVSEYLILGYQRK